MYKPPHLICRRLVILSSRFKAVCAGVLMILLSLFLHSAAFASDPGKPLVFILSGNSPVYTEVATETEQFARIDCPPPTADCAALRFKQLTADDSSLEEIRKAWLTVTLGTRARDWIARQSVTVTQLNAMLPYPHGDAKQTLAGTSLAEIFIDQPYRRYFELIRATVPRAGRVGLLIHESDLGQVDSIRTLAAESGLSLTTSIVGADHKVGEALSHLLNDMDVLLALPDSRIHNNRTISHILTTAYRNGIPVVGFSSAYVKAGATAALYTAPDDIAHQVSDTILEFLHKGRIRNRQQKASYYSVSFNFEVARSLGLPPISPSEIKQAILQEAVE